MRLDGHGWRALTAQDPVIAELRILCRNEVALIEERTALVNQLQQALHEYYPTALEAFDDWTSVSAWSFVETFSSPEAHTKAGKRKWEKFLHSHKLYRPKTHQKRIDTFQQAAEWHVGAALAAVKSFLAVALCKQLRVLQLQLDTYRKRIKAIFASHPDSGMFGSLPRACPKLAPRLLSEIGSDRALYKTRKASIAWLGPHRSTTNPARFTKFASAAVATNICDTQCTCLPTRTAPNPRGLRFAIPHCASAA